MSDMLAARSMTFFAADIPFGHLFGLHVVIDGMAAVTIGTGGPVKVARAIKRNPPIRSRFDVIWQPTLLRYVPLSRQWIIVVAPLGELSLLPSTPIDEHHLFQTEGANRISIDEAPQNRFRMGVRIAYDVRHTCLLPSVVSVCVAFSAAL